MNSHYYVVEIHKRNRRNTVVGMEKLSRVAAFVAETECRRVESHHDCEVYIYLAYVSQKERHLLERFKADGITIIKHRALGGFADEENKTPAFLRRQAE